MLCQCFTSAVHVSRFVTFTLLKGFAELQDMTDGNEVGGTSMNLFCDDDAFDEGRPRTGVILWRLPHLLMNADFGFRLFV